MILTKTIIIYDLLQNISKDKNTNIYLIKKTKLKIILKKLKNTILLHSRIRENLSY